jgi:hypothetical protein
MEENEIMNQVKDQKKQAKTEPKIQIQKWRREFYRFSTTIPEEAEPGLCVTLSPTNFSS